MNILITDIERFSELYPIIFPLLGKISTSTYGFFDKLAEDKESSDDFIEKHGIELTKILDKVLPDNVNEWNLYHVNPLLDRLGAVDAVKKLSEYQRLKRIRESV